MNYIKSDSYLLFSFDYDRKLSCFGLGLGLDHGPTVGEIGEKIGDMQPILGTKKKMKKKKGPKKRGGNNFNLKSSKYLN